MREILKGPLQAAAVTGFIVGTTLFVLNPPSLSGAEDVLSLVAGGIALALLASWFTVVLMGDGLSEHEVDRITDRSETLARLPAPAGPPTAFDTIVEDALDELPAEFREILADVPVIVSRQGREHGAYGHYYGDTVARDNYPDRIVVYQDTLERDFGHDPDLLRRQVRQTVRHEIAHHLGWDEGGVRRLGL